MRALRLLLAAAALVAAWAPGAARAATVSLTYVGTTPATPDQYKIAGSPAVDRYLIRLTAGAGERNRMVVDVLGRARFAVSTADTVRVPLRLGDLPRRPCGTLRATLRLEPARGRPTVTTSLLGRCTWRAPARPVG